MVAILLVAFLMLLLAIAVAVSHIRIPVLNLSGLAAREQKVKALDQWFVRLHSAGKFNGAVLLCRSGEVVFSGCYGGNGATPSQPLTLNSSFNLASVSKHITAYGILLLHHRGVLQVDDLLKKHIPEMSQYSDVTIKHLLHHTSGIPDYMSLARKAGFKKPVFTTEDMLQLFKLHTSKPNFSAGDKFLYSNTGYVLLAEIISRVSGQSFESFCQSELFNPLGMKNTRVFNLLSTTEFEGRVFGYKKSWPLKRIKQMDLNRFDGVVGDGAVYSSVNDLKIWHDALISHTLVPEEVAGIAYESGVLNDGEKTHYGFGWLIGPDGGVEHSGGWQAFTSYYHRNLQRNDLVVLLDNSGNTIRVNGMGFRFHSIGANLRAVVGNL